MLLFSLNCVPNDLALLRFVLEMLLAVVAGPVVVCFSSL